MEKSFWLIGYVFVFLIFFALIVDIGILGELKETAKNSLDFSTKAAALQVDTNPALISQGIFRIDIIQSKAAFIQVMSANLDTDSESIKDFMVDYKAINTPSVYTDPSNNDKYNITNPTFVAPMRFKFTGLVIKQDIIINNNFAGSQLTTK